MAFTPRVKIPDSGNKYYNTKSNKGYNTAIVGSPTQTGLNVLSNCVGYAIGRFHEIANDPTFKYLKAVNAGLFIQYADKSLTISKEPQVGAVIVWSKNGGAGHVAIVEKVISTTEIVTSESGWKASKPFWTQTRKKGNGNWGQGSAYKFLGFIYNPSSDCKIGFSANSTIGSMINNNTATNVSGVRKEKKAKEVAKSVDKSLSGTYIVKANDGLNIRDGAGTDKEVLETFPYGTRVQNYGYYTIVNGVKWLYVTAIYYGIKYTGFVSSAYLKK